MATNDEVAATAEGHGLRCEEVEDLGDGASHLSCGREPADQSVTNIDLSVTYNVYSADDEFASATVAAFRTPPPADWLDVATAVALLFCEEPPEAVRQAVESTAPQTELSGCRVQASPDDFAPSIDIWPAPPSAEPPGAPATWSTEGTSTYGGTWTLTAYGIDGEFGEPEYGLGDSVPGTITLDCATSDDHCGFITTRDGEQWWVVGLEVIAEGRLRYVDESELENCDDGQTVRTTHEVTYGPEDATASIAQMNLPRTCTYEDGTLYSTDTTWSFEGVLTEHVPPAAGAALMLAVAFGAWFALGALPDGEAFALTVVRTGLAALMVAGLEGVVFGLLPMRFLPGEPLYAWNRILWGGLLLVGAFAFFHILINPASGYLSDSSRTPLFTVVGLLLGFSFVSVAFWAWFRCRPESEEVAGASQ